MARSTTGLFFYSFGKIIIPSISQFMSSVPLRGWTSKKGRLVGKDKTRYLELPEDARGFFSVSVDDGRNFLEAREET